MDNDRLIKILFLASDPSDTARLRLGQELRDIRERLQLAKYRDRFALDSRESVRVGDISQALLDLEPQIVHFSGHGMSTGELCFEDIGGKMQPVKPDALTALFELVAEQINCVVLNACYSERQAEAISKHISFVIGMNQAIGDKAAISFSAGFYKALGANRSIEIAYKFGCAEIKLQGIAEDLTPVLHKKQPISLELQSGKWVLVLTATIDEVDKPKAEAIVAHLRQLTGDSTITLKKIEPGSVKITLESFQGGLEVIELLLREGKLPEVMGILVQDFYREEMPSNVPFTISDTSSYIIQDYTYRHFRFDSEYLYNHFLELRREESPANVIERFRSLFISGINYPDLTVLDALSRIVASPWASQEFTLIISRCCYIFINYWWLHPELKTATVELVQLFGRPYPNETPFPITIRLKELIEQFAQSEQYGELKDRARIIGYALPALEEAKSEPIRNLIPRYPYLYPYCVLNWDTSEIGQRAVKQIQEERVRQFEQGLSLYMTNRLRRSSRSASIEINNPTLLSPQQLESAVRHFVGNAEGSYTYQERAQQFVSHSKDVSSYYEIKREMYDYLTTTITYSHNPNYGRHYFNQWLSVKLDETLPQSNNLYPSNYLLVTTCGQLLDSLIASPSQINNHVVFVDLITNLGATFTVGLLLKIVLLCRAAKSGLEVIRAHLARRFAILLKHYETRVGGEIEWLIECLENLNVANATNFGQLDFTWIRLL